MLTKQKDSFPRKKPELANMGASSASNTSPNHTNASANSNSNPNSIPSHAVPTPNPRYSTAFVSFSSIRSSARRITNTLSPAKQTEPYVFSGKDSPRRFSTDRSSTSSRSSQQTHLRPRAASSSTASLPYFSDQKSNQKHPIRHQPSASATFPTNLPTRGLRRVDDVIPNSLSRAATASSIPRESVYRSANSAANMTVTPFGSNSRTESVKSAVSSQSNSGFGQGANASPLPGTGLSAGYVNAPPGSLQNPITVRQHIQEMASKRISTLEYLRKAHEGRVYWFNTLLFSKPDLMRVPFFETKKLARRATNYLLLGISLPTILDLNASNAFDYLRTLHALLLEFESYQQMHPPEGSSSASSLSRARIPHMFKRATHAAGTKGRRTSSATEIGLPMHTNENLDLKAIMNGGSGSGPSAGSSFPTSEQELLQGEDYAHLLTPSLPFDPDFFETFATLCEVLIDCYKRILSLVHSPAMCTPGVGEIFVKADSRIRKIIVTGIVKEFEEASRSGAKTELAGVSKILLGGLV